MTALTPLPGACHDWSNGCRILIISRFRELRALGLLRVMRPRPWSTLLITLELLLLLLLLHMMQLWLLQLMRLLLLVMLNVKVLMLWLVLVL